MNSVNTFARSIFDDLVEKRLWPVAVALALALVAIPLLLSSSAGTKPAATPAPAAPATSGGSLSAFQPVVASDGKKSSEIRKDLQGFDSKDPFKPQNVGGGGGAAAGGSAAAATAQPTGTTGSGSATPPAASGSTPTGSTGSPTGSSGGDTGSGSSGATTKPQTFYYTYRADVRFGKQGNLDRKTLSQFRPLPSSADPVAVFMGVREDGKTAIFLLSSAASSTGEGNCEPDDTCTFLYMKKGDKQTFEAVATNNEVVTYELVLLGIDVKRTTGPDKAAASNEARSKRSKRNKRAVEETKGNGNPFARGFQTIGF